MDVILNLKVIIRGSIKSRFILPGNEYYLGWTVIFVDDDANDRKGKACAVTDFSDVGYIAIYEFMKHVISAWRFYGSSISERGLRET